MAVSRAGIDIGLSGLLANLYPRYSGTSTPRLVEG